jgi:hypothetical protein
MDIAATEIISLTDRLGMPLKTGICHVPLYVLYEVTKEQESENG